MLKMLMDPMGGIVLTNDGNAILREIEVAHPASKSMLEIARAQDEEQGDGTTTVIILTGELLSLCAPILSARHPIVIINGLRRALVVAQAALRGVARPVVLEDDEAMRKLIRSSVQTKLGGRWSNALVNLALTAIRTVAPDLDTKRFVRIEKIPGEDIEASAVVDGVVVNKDVTHPSMRRFIENPRIVLIDCPLEYKKAESQTNIELCGDAFSRALEIEEEQVRGMCEAILAVRPDLVITEKGVSDYAQHLFVRADVSVLRRVRKSDLLRISRAVGANIAGRAEDLRDSDVGTGCGLFRIDKIGDEYFSFLEKCQAAKACSVVLRGASKEILGEIERDLQDAIAVCRSLYREPLVVAGGGAAEMAIGAAIRGQSKDTGLGVMLGSFLAVADALEVIPRTLVANCGGDVIRTLTGLRARHANGEASWGVHGSTGAIVDMAEYGVWDPLGVKMQALQTAVEVLCALIVDGIYASASGWHFEWGFQTRQDGAVC